MLFSPCTEEFRVAVADADCLKPLLSIGGASTDATLPAVLAVEKLTETGTVSQYRDIARLNCHRGDPKASRCARVCRAPREVQSTRITCDNQRGQDQNSCPAEIKFWLGPDILCGFFFFFVFFCCKGDIFAGHSTAKRTNPNPGNPNARNPIGCRGFCWGSAAPAAAQASNKTRNLPNGMVERLAEIDRRLSQGCTAEGICKSDPCFQRP